MIDAVHFDDAGLVPAIAQEAGSGRVLMMAWMNAEAIEQTIASGFAHYYSRSRQKQWQKGESSGHVQKVVSMHLDCDGDTILLTVQQTGPACHTNRGSCFYRELRNSSWTTIEDPMDGMSEEILQQLTDVLEARKAQSPDASYVAALYAKPDKMLQKIGEEAVETIIAAKNGDREQMIYETADLWFHCMVMLAANGLTAQDVLCELGHRFGVSGHEEKAARTG